MGIWLGKSLRVVLDRLADGSRMTISLTAVLNFANDEEWKMKIAKEVFSGKKKICLVRCLWLRLSL